jgi:septal ring-binding cell division protein DamX
MSKAQARTKAKKAEEAKEKVQEETANETEAADTRAEIAEESAPATEDSGPAEKGKASFEVYDKNGALVRTYTVQIHGDGAKELAEEFATKIGGTVQ